MESSNKLKEYWSDKAHLSLGNFVEFIYDRNPGAVYECRILGSGGNNYTGYFDNGVALAKSVLPRPESPREKIPFGDYPRITEGNFYLTMNPVQKDLLARSANKFIRAKTGDGSSNEDIEKFNMFFIDVDPKRKSGISANDTERREARKVWVRMRRFLRKHGVKPIPASSGNGYHIIILTHTYSGPDIARAAERGKKILEYLKMKFETETAEVDTTVCTPAHLIKLYGSLAIKGSSIPERPHRYATIEIQDPLPPDVDIFSLFREEIEAGNDEQEQKAIPAATEGPAQEKIDQKSVFKKSIKRMEAFLEYTKLDFKKINNPAMVIYSFRECPYHQGSKDHKYECCVTVSKKVIRKSDGAIILAGTWGADCKHEADAGWQEFKVALGWDKYTATLNADNRAYDTDGADDKLTSLEITDLFLEYYTVNRIVYRMGVFFIWNGSKYEEFSPEAMNGFIMRYLQNNTRVVSEDQTSSACVREVVANLKGRCLIPDVDFNSFISGNQPQGNYVSVQNGILSLDIAISDSPDNALLPATSDFFTLVSLPYAYEASAGCPVWRRFLDEILPDEGMQIFLQEWFGYNLTTNLFYEIFVIFEGLGANGKSVVLKVLRALLGPENVSSVPIELLEKPFNRYEMYGKLANIVTEMGEAEKVAEEIIKAIVSGDPIQFERKRVDAFSAITTVKMSFATNVLPPIRDRTNAIWRRMVVMPFMVQIPEEQQDKGLADRLIAIELPGILVWAIEGLKRLNQRGRFIIPEVCRAAGREYQLESNSVRRFVEEACDEGDTLEIQTQELYRAYKEFCESTGCKYLGDVQFGKEIKRACRKVNKVGLGTGKGKAYRGIALLNNPIRTAAIMDLVDKFSNKE